MNNNLAYEDLLDLMTASSASTAINTSAGPARSRATVIQEATFSQEEEDAIEIRTEPVEMKLEPVEINKTEPIGINFDFADDFKTEPIEVKFDSAIDIKTEPIEIKFDSSAIGVEVEQVPRSSSNTAV